MSAPPVTWTLAPGAGRCLHGTIGDSPHSATVVYAQGYPRGRDRWFARIDTQLDGAIATAAPSEHRTEAAATKAAEKRLRASVRDA